jgi:hypothetical protein
MFMKTIGLHTVGQRRTVSGAAAGDLARSPGRRRIGR